MSQGNLHKGAIGNIFSYARLLRKNETEAEKMLWSYLKGRGLNNFKFRRQHPLKNYIADFYCHECKLVIELDGGVHDDWSQKEYDAGRTHDLSEYGIKTLRFRNEDILRDIPQVLNQIKQHLTPPSPQGEGQGEVFLPK